MILSQRFHSSIAGSLIICTQSTLPTPGVLRPLALHALGNPPSHIHMLLYNRGLLSAHCIRYNTIEIIDIKLWTR